MMPTNDLYSFDIQSTAFAALTIMRNAGFDNNKSVASE